MADIVRCPYCVLADNFRPMLPKPEGLFVCQKCGHAVMLGNSNFKCSCKKCEELNRVKRCEIVEMANLADEVGYPCAKTSSQRCSDCGIAICDSHTQTCDICREVFCPSCLTFHLAVHPKPATAERGKDRKIA